MVVRPFKDSGGRSRSSDTRNIGPLGEYDAAVPCQCIVVHWILVPAAFAYSSMHRMRSDGYSGISLVNDSVGGGSTGAFMQLWGVVVRYSADSSLPALNFLVIQKNFQDESCRCDHSMYNNDIACFWFYIVLASYTFALQKWFLQNEDVGPHIRVVVCLYCF